MFKKTKTGFISEIDQLLHRLRKEKPLTQSQKSEQKKAIKLKKGN